MAVLVVLVVRPAGATEATPDPVLTIFWGDGCPHCEAEWEFLTDLTAEFPELEVIGYEVWYNDANRTLFVATMEARGLKARSVPTTLSPPAPSPPGSGEGA